MRGFHLGVLNLGSSVVRKKTHRSSSHRMFQTVTACRAAARSAEEEVEDILPPGKTPTVRLWVTTSVSGGPSVTRRHAACMPRPPQYAPAERAAGISHLVPRVLGDFAGAGLTLLDVEGHKDRGSRCLEQLRGECYDC